MGSMFWEQLHSIQCCLFVLPCPLKFVCWHATKWKLKNVDGYGSILWASSDSFSCWAKWSWYIPQPESERLVGRFICWALRFFERLFCFYFFIPSFPSCIFYCRDLSGSDLWLGGRSTSLFPPSREFDTCVCHSQVYVYIYSFFYKWMQATHDPPHGREFDFCASPFFIFIYLSHYSLTLWILNLWCLSSFSQNLRIFSQLSLSYFHWLNIEF